MRNIKNKSFRLLVLLSILVWGSTALYGSQDNTKIVKYDSSAVKVLHFDQEALDRYRNNPEFHYDGQTLDISWWQRFKLWVTTKIDELMSREGSQLLLRNIIIILGVAALVYLILRLLGMDVARIMMRNTKRTPLAYAEQEDIRTMDLEKELLRAIDAGNYRLAVRLLYLDCLKKLNDCKLIDWQPAKTNTAYVNELDQMNLRWRFGQLTRQFEYIWYGNFSITQQHFVQLQDDFRQFNGELT